MLAWMLALKMTFSYVLVTELTRMKLLAVCGSSPAILPRLKTEQHPSVSHVTRPMGRGYPVTPAVAQGEEGDTTTELNK